MYTHTHTYMRMVCLDLFYSQSTKWSNVIRLTRQCGTHMDACMRSSSLSLRALSAARKMRRNS